MKRGKEEERRKREGIGEEEKRQEKRQGDKWERGR